MRQFGVRCRDLARTEAFQWALGMGTFSGSLSAVLRVLHERGVVDIVMWVPDIAIFGFFITFASLVAAFRTANALGRYTDAAMYLHRLSACWFDSASTLFAFCRASDASDKDIHEFQHLIVRLMSLLSAFCLQSLQSSVPQDTLKTSGFRFEILGSTDLDPVTQQMVLESKNKVEFIFQMVQQLVVDAQKSGVLSIPPPILTRSYQELGSGLVAFHEAKKLACVPIPFAYVLITGAILLTEAVFVPFMTAINTKGVLSSFVFSFGATFLIWFMNGVADALDNPFNREARSLDASSVQHELNEHLLQLLRQAASPSVRLVAAQGRLASEIERNRNSIATWARIATVKQISGVTERHELEEARHSELSDPEPPEPPEPAVAPPPLALERPREAPRLRGREARAISRLPSQVDEEGGGLAQVWELPEFRPWRLTGTRHGAPRGLAASSGMMERGVGRTGAQWT